MDFTVSNNLCIEGATTEQKRIITDVMTFSNPKYQEAAKFKRSTWGIPKYIRLYEVDNGKLILPRGSLSKIIDNVGSPNSFIDNTMSFPRVKIKSNIKLRPLQMPWVESMLGHVQGIGVAAAGSGKTVSALKIISILGQPTLWITHRQQLVDQFIERVGFFIDAGNVGVIGGGKFELGDIITAGTTQTLMRNDLSEITNKFGVIFVDEAHIIPAISTLKVVRQFPSKHLYGLTATPYREDKLEEIMFAAIGPRIAFTERNKIIESKGIIPAKVKVRYTKHAGVNNTQDNYNTIMKMLLKHPGRNNMIIIDVLTELVLGNKCIILTNRVEHGKIIKRKLGELGTECVHIHAHTTKKQRREKLTLYTEGKVAVIIATYALLKEGFDDSPTSRIFFALPSKAKGSIVQAKGRIERTHPGKLDAVLYDYVDPIQMLLNQFDIRCEQYYEHNLEFI